MIVRIFAALLVASVLLPTSAAAKTDSLAGRVGGTQARSRTDWASVGAEHADGQVVEYARVKGYAAIQVTVAKGVVTWAFFGPPDDTRWTADDGEERAAGIHPPPRRGPFRGADTGGCRRFAHLLPQRSPGQGGHPHGLRGARLGGTPRHLHVAIRVSKESVASAVVGIGLGDADPFVAPAASSG